MFKLVCFLDNKQPVYLQDPDHFFFNKKLISNDEINSKISIICLNIYQS